MSALESTFQGIDNPAQQTRVLIEEQALGSGGQGSVFLAHVVGGEERCVKVLPGIAPGELRNEIAMLQRLRSRTKSQLENPSVQGALRENAEALWRYLPDLVAFQKVPGYDRAEFILSRAFCNGLPLHELMLDSAIETRDAFYRITLARKVCRLMVSMELFGIVHLDAYPDNVFVEEADDAASLRVAMIDLEGVGVIAASDEDNDRHGRRDDFERSPRSFSKDDFWILPWWFPVPGKTRVMSDWFIHAARYQMLSLITLTLTWGATPGCWLKQDALHELQSIAEFLRESGTAPTEADRKAMVSCIDASRVDLEVMNEFVARCGNVTLANHLMSWFSTAFLGPSGSSWRWFSGKDLQNALNEARV